MRRRTSADPTAGPCLQPSPLGDREPGFYAVAMLTVERWPELHEPLLVAALTGWVDAGFAGAGAMEALGAQLDGPEQFATLDLTDLLDLQQTRPTARFVTGGLRVIEWPRIALGVTPHACQSWASAYSITNNAGCVISV